MTVSAVPEEPSKGDLVIIATAALTGCSTIVFGLRLFTRCVILKTAGADDWTLLVAQILAIVYGITTALGTFLVLAAMLNGG